MRPNTHNPCREDFSGHDITCYRVAKRPSESIQVDKHDSHNAAGRCTALVGFRHSRRTEADIEGKVKHGSALDRCSDQQRQASTDAAATHQQPVAFLIAMRHMAYSTRNPM